MSDGMRNVNCVAPLACRLCIELGKERRPVFNDVCRLRVRDQTKRCHIEFWLPNVNRGGQVDVDNRTFLSVVLHSSLAPASCFEVDFHQMKVQSAWDIPQINGRGFISSGGRMSTLD